MMAPPAQVYDAQFHALKEFRRTSFLRNIPIRDALHALRAACGNETRITYEQFASACEALMDESTQDPHFGEQCGQMFDLFDIDHNGVIDMMELMYGLSALCAGSDDEKLQTVFDGLDENGDGYLSLEELHGFLLSVFRVVLSPAAIHKMNSMGVTVESIEELASSTAEECFSEADLNRDGKVSVSEFKIWFRGSSDNDAELGSLQRMLA